MTPPAGDTTLAAWSRALALTAPYARDGGQTLPGLVAAIAASRGESPALLDEHRHLTYTSLVALMNRYARWAVGQDLAPGEVVGLLLPNCAEYAAVWLGITSVRGVVALINPSVNGDALVFALTAVMPRHIIVDAEYEAGLQAVLSRLPGNPRIWSFGGGNAGPSIDSAIRDLSPDPLEDDEKRTPELTDLALHIYTSGTTGLPKAANVSHRRVAEWSCWFAGMIDTRFDDRMFNCLPMFHSVGGVVAVGAMLAGGGSVLIRSKFSASRFWNDIIEHDCTVFQYIGELCRHLLNSPSADTPPAHKLRLCCGNGLRGDVWQEFQEHFRIPRILEFYASTEGNVSLYNCPGRPGAIGHIPAFLAHRSPVALARCDAETGALLRDADGLGSRCSPGETGEALGRIKDPANAANRAFEGYTDRAAADAKIARDVFTKGDAWYRTGDLMHRDTAGFFYFVDRLGDNFRWKGENIATDWVADVVRVAPGVRDCVIYGVTVAGNEGRAGMAALVIEDSFTLNGFRSHIAEHLPSYAWPVFLRITDSITATATFKPLRAAFAREGYDPGSILDTLYVHDRAQSAYVQLDARVLEDVTMGDLKI